MIDLHHLKIFTLVADKKSFSAAAEAASLTQPTVSSHIKHLEDILGVSLFDRLPRRVELTGAGKILYSYSRKILDLQKDALEAVNEFLGRVTGVLNVGGSTIPGEYILPKLLGPFGEAAPEVEICLSIADSDEITTQVIEGGLELGVVGTPPVSESIEDFILCGDRLVLIVHPSHRFALKGAREVRWDEIADEPFWMREPGSGTQKTLLTALAAKGRRLFDVNVKGRLGSTEAVKQAVRTGAGISFVSYLAVRDDLADGRLYGLGVSGLELTRNFYVIRLRNRSPSPAAAFFHAFLLESGRP